MGDIPSLFSLCLKTIERAIIYGYDRLQEIFELPSDLFDCLLMHLSPLALQNLHAELSSLSDFQFHKCGTSTNFINGRKRGRYGDLNGAWKILFQSRWPNHVKQNSLTKKDVSERGESINCIIDWRQLYWEAHLQNCLDEASEKALLPSFNGSIGEIKISDTIIKSIGCRGDIGCDYARLSYHCQNFGCHVRHLRLQNVLCVAETCDLLSSCKLEDLVFCNIKSKVHVDGICNLLKEHSDTLLSLKFLHCKLPPAAFDDICDSLGKGQTNVIQHLSFLSSSIFGGKPASVSGFLYLLSSGRSLVSLKFCETQMGPAVAKSIFDTLLDSSSGLSALEISDNNITGWLSKANRGSGSFSQLCLGSESSLKFLRVLNLRGNNLCKDDAEDLKYALIYMPNLSSLDISDNPLTDDGIRNLIPYFVQAFEKFCPLSDIKIENCNLSCMGVTQLLMAVPCSKPPLNSLSIAENDLGRSIAVTLAIFLTSSRVKELNIEDIGLGLSGFQEFEENLPKTIELVCINISKNRGGIGAARFIYKVILQAPQLLEVSAGHNFMPPESLEIICDALRQSKGKLKKLDLTGNTQLYQPTQTPNLVNFHCHGKSIVVLPSAPSSVAPYDDDP